MNNTTFKILLLATIIAFAGINTTAIAQTPTVTPDSLPLNINPYSALPLGIITPPDTTTDVMIILDNSASMRRVIPGPGETSIALVGGHHPKSRSYEARLVLRDIFQQLFDDGSQVNVGLMEFDMAWETQNNNGGRIAVNTCLLYTSPSPRDRG